MKTVSLLVKVDVPDTMTAGETATILDALILAGIGQAATTPEAPESRQPLTIEHHFPEVVPQPHPSRFANLPEDDE